MRKPRLRIASVSLVLLLATALAFFAWQRHTSQIDYQLRRGREALRRDEPRVAAAIADRLRADGHEDVAHLLQGEVHFQQHRFDPALEELDKLSSQSEFRLDALALAGQCLLRLGRVRQAERALTAVARERPDDADTHRGLAAIYFDQGASDLALHHLGEVARLDPADGRPHRTMGMLHRELDDHARAIPCYREALRRGLQADATEEVREELAHCLVEQRAYIQALDIIQPCEPTPTILVLRGECLWGQGRAPECRAALDRALELAPRSPDALLLRAKLHLEDAEPLAAARHLELALTIDAHDYACRYQLALAYDMLGRHAEAAEQHRRSEHSHADINLIAALKEQAQKDPWDPGVRRRLAALYRKLNNPAQAALWLQAAAACSGRTKPAAVPPRSG